MSSLAARNLAECMTRGLSVVYLMPPILYVEILRSKRHARHVQVTGVRSPWGFNAEIYGQTVWIRVQHTWEAEVIRLEFFGSVSRQAGVTSSMSRTIRQIESMSLGAFLKQVNKGGGK